MGKPVGATEQADKTPFPPGQQSIAQRCAVLGMDGAKQVLQIRRVRVACGAEQSFSVGADERAVQRVGVKRKHD